MTDDDPVLSALADAIAQAEAAQRELAVEMRGLRLARERRLRFLASNEREGARVVSSHTSEQHVVPARVAQWRAMTRTDAVLRMLRESGGQLHRKDLATRLVKAGREDETVEAVSAALAYLAREPNARVAAMGHGFWQLLPAIFDSGPAGDAIREAYARGEAPRDDDDEGHASAFEGEGAPG